jgi:Ca2+/Na+ antiporter
MGYFDAISSGSFKTMPDGRRLFFPWGVFGRGYAIPTEAEYDGLRRQAKIYTGVSLVVIIAVAMMQHPLWTFGVGIALAVAYAGWAYVRMRHLEPTEEELSFRESLSTQAFLHNKVVLWTMEVVSILYVVTGLIILVVDPQSWLIALGSIVFFGACAVVFACMLTLRKRASA